MTGDELEIGSSVEVKPLIQDSETGFDLGSWQGRIVDFYHNDNGDQMAQIRWDSVTLENLPIEFITYCMNNNLDWLDIIIGVDSLEITSQRDSKDEADWKRAELLTKYKWSKMGIRGKRVGQILNHDRQSTISSILENWENHLASQLAFPFFAKIRKTVSHEIKQGSIINVISLNGGDDSLGIWVLAGMNDRQFIIPLFTLSVSNHTINSQTVKDYCFWFKNR